MSNPATEAVTETATVENNDSATQAEQPKPTETVDFWKAKAREQEKRAKDNATAAQRLKEFEDRDKTEAEKAAERVTTSEKRATEAETRATRLEVILDKLPADATAEDVKRLVALSKRLVGNTREELEADADELLATFKTSGNPRPSGDIGQGTRPAATITDPRQRDLAQIEADLKAGKSR
jgi:hypothetical protein